MKPKGPHLPLADRLERYIEYDVMGGCWLWAGVSGPNGYGRIRAGQSLATVHRVAYELARGKIPDRLVIDHLCRVRLCCNPAHLEAVTQRENLLRGHGINAVNARKTHCIHGHEFTPANTIRTRRKRSCRTCRNLQRHKRREQSIPLPQGEVRPIPRSGRTKS